jgi:hypothetical membrane protein
MSTGISTTRRLLRAGVAAGILVPLVVLIDGATRTGYSLWRNGVSQLGTGDRAWLFATTFVIGGLLLALFAIGLRGALGGGKGGTWGPIMLVVAAVGFVVGGLVPTDPALGYPTNETGPASVAAAIHQVAGLLIFAGIAAAAFILARRIAEDGQGWAIYSRVSGVLIIALAFAAGIAYRLDSLDIWRPGPAGLLEQVSLVVGYIWLVVIARHYLRRSHAQ